MISLRGLTKEYGATRAVDGLTLEVAKGEVCGLIGPNGAGKTTTIKMLATLLRPTSGDALIAGLSIREAVRAARAKIGYMPDLYGLYEAMTVADYLGFFAAAYELAAEARGRIVGQVMEVVGVAGSAADRIGDLSRGTQQRVSLARVLVHDPEVLILDEPASGLDPRARIEVREVLRELKRMGKTIFVSSHILPELEEICDRVAILDRGKLVWTGRPDEGREREGVRRRVRVRPAAGKLAAAVAALGADLRIVSAEAEGEEVTATLGGADPDLSIVPRILLGKEVDFVSLVEVRPGLEEIFLAVTGREGPPA